MHGVISASGRAKGQTQCYPVLELNLAIKKCHEGLILATAPGNLVPSPQLPGAVPALGTWSCHTPLRHLAVEEFSSTVAPVPMWMPQCLPARPESPPSMDLGSLCKPKERPFQHSPQKVPSYLVQPLDLVGDSVKDSEEY